MGCGSCRGDDIRKRYSVRFDVVDAEGVVKFPQQAFPDAKPANGVSHEKNNPADAKKL
jgi:hypothetical protein